MLDRLARLADRSGRRVVILAVVFFALAGFVGGSVVDRLDPYGAEDPDTESVQANERLQEAGFRSPGVIVLIEDVSVTEPVGRERVDEVRGIVESESDAAEVAGFADTRSRAFVSEDGDATYLSVALEPTDDKESQEAAERIEESLAGEEGVSVGGGALAEAQVNEQVESDLQRAELIAFPLLFLLSLLFFRSVVAAMLPLLVGALAIVGTFLILRVASELGSVSIFALNLTTGLGLGLAIDYSLFIVSRYREEIAKDGPGLAAMRRTLATAGRTVLFSSLTVAAALASLLVFPQRFLYSMGLGGSMVALFAAAVALIVLPAVLTLLGHRVNSLAPKFLQRRAERDARAGTAGFWYRLSRFVMRRPLRIALISAVALVVAGLPFLRLEFTSVDAQVLPSSASARQVDDVLRAEFPPFRDSPIRLLVEDTNARGLSEVRADVERVDGIVAVNPTRRLENGSFVVEAVANGPYIDQSVRDTTEAVRDLPEPAGGNVLVTGATAEFLDFQQSLSDHLPLVIAIVAITTLVILFLMTGSVVLPLKSLVMNVLNLSAVFGLLVLIFQDGRFEGFLDYTSQGALEQTMPILLFAVAFGLSTDYAVFLLSRIKEARDSGVSDSESVAVGLERTGRIVTAAAVLFAIAIGAFATSEIVFIKQNGIGTALAVLIDASIIRALLVPSLMELLGKWNWWAPQPLRRIHARLGLSEA
ncbi:MAG: MMPL family transporter [Solirubrobacterales bacterium]